MYRSSSSAVAFSMPGGERSEPARSRPIDFAHLSRQTMGDRALEQEVLKLFVQQAGRVRDRIGEADGAEVKALAHGLKGSARGIGAFAIADCAGEIEEAPHDRAAIRKLCRLVDETRSFIAAITR